ncbi:glycosyltransferase [Sphingomonas sp. PAMC 26621]|uniref:glycosyltransferase n=1 Tax=Sphingomonas sp. PAMC 26621 TaxID=1112213 RepID=UPI000287F875|nr:glycosyltransferase [Sphingomonas sp. PAMC 26621]
MVAVCVPVRNEAVLLPRLLDALARQQRAGSFVLCVVFDACTDDSAAVVAARCAALPYAVVTQVLPPNTAPNAGRARAAAMALGLATVGETGVLLSTDADSVPATDWIASNIEALDLADIAAGLIVRSGGAASPVQDRIEAYYDGLARLRRLLDPVPWENGAPHHYTSAASLGCSGATYLRLGGFAAVAAGEDARLVDQAYRLGLRVRRDCAIRVETSTRRDGRARGGLADHLRDLDQSGGGSARMAHPEDVAWRYARHAVARAAWPVTAAGAGVLAEALCCGHDHIHEAAADAETAEAFAIRVVPDVPGGERLVDLATAEAALATLLLQHQGVAA